LKLVQKLAACNSKIAQKIVREPGPCDTSSIFNATMLQIAPSNITLKDGLKELYNANFHPGHTKPKFLYTRIAIFNKFKTEPLFSRLHRGKCFLAIQSDTKNGYSNFIWIFLVN